MKRWNHISKFIEHGEVKEAQWLHRAFDTISDGEAQKERFKERKEAVRLRLRTWRKKSSLTLLRMAINMDMIASASVLVRCGSALQFPTLTNLTSSTPATTPDTFHEFIDSIKFLQGGASKCEKVKLCGTDVLLWVPHEAVDDTTLVLLDSVQTFQGM